MRRAADGTLTAEAFFTERESAWPALAGAALALAVLCAFFFRGGAGEEGMALALAAAALAFAFACALPAAWSRSARPLAVDLWMGAVAVFAVIPLAWHPAPHAGIVAALTVGGAAAFYCVGRSLAASESTWRVAGAGFVLVGLMAAAWALGGAAVGATRVAALFLDVNNFAAYLSLMAFVLGAWLVGEGAAGRRVPGRAGAALAILILVAALLSTGSRGALLGLIAGLVVLGVGLARRHAPARVAALMAGTIGSLVLLAFAFAALSTDGVSLLERLIAGGPRLAGQMTGRTELWAGAWDLLRAAPWSGIGLGVWWLAYPPHRRADDMTTGFHAHNDYLQYATEGGIVFALLAVGLGIALLRRATLAMRAADPAKSSETAFLCGGLAALAVHSVFNFNLVMAPIAWCAALAAARLVNLSTNAASASIPAPASHSPLRRAGLAAAVLALGAGTLYLAASAVGGVQYALAREAHARGDFLGAMARMSSALAWAPWQDTIALAHADLLVKRALTDAAARAPLAAEAARILDRVGMINPYKPHQHVLRGHLARLEGAVAAPLREAAAESAYRRALALDPAYAEATHALARLLLDSGRPAEARVALLAAPLTFRGQPIDLETHWTLLAHAQARSGARDEALAAAVRAGDLRRDGRGAAFVAAFRRGYGW
ncbi:MAG: O-antigen ligase family protein [Burkholderiales bacterium]